MKVTGTVCAPGEAFSPAHFTARPLFTLLLHPQSEASSSQAPLPLQLLTLLVRTMSLFFPLPKAYCFQVTLIST